MERPSCGIRNFIPPPASGLDLGPGGRNRSVGDEERSHSAPSNCTVGRRGTEKVSHSIYTMQWSKGIKPHSQTRVNISHPAIINPCMQHRDLWWMGRTRGQRRSRCDRWQNYQHHHNYHHQPFYETPRADRDRKVGVFPDWLCHVFLFQQTTLQISWCWLYWSHVQCYSVIYPFCAWFWCYSIYRTLRLQNTLQNITCTTVLLSALTRLRHSP